MTISVKILELMVNVLENNGSMRAQLPSFVKLKSFKVEAGSWRCDERIREMITYLLQNSSPPATFVIGQEVDMISDSRMFIGCLRDFFGIFDII
ncbi:hypothetical protein TSUD_111360 [Trifolium subterraneum]|uniref:Uncharacterized protein n=1 Tax=Trifolium subterraneum TaxID=3900 RepID=A0A2Z6LT50_TRISU|nr:hypothetical protein TSUD_111360 [Trifolium subterraneum]